MPNIDPLYIIIAAMWAEYGMDDCCDYRKINRMIEEASDLVSKRVGGLDRLDKISESYIPDTIWELFLSEIERE